jgi:hypothetical protein
MPFSPTLNCFLASCFAGVLSVLLTIAVVIGSALAFYKATYKYPIHAQCNLKW